MADEVASEAVNDRAFEGPAVLWGPGRVVLGFALAMAAVWFVQEGLLPEETEASEEVVEAAVPVGVEEILSKADLDASGGAATVGGPKMPDQKRGLVNLYKTIAGATEGAEGESSASEQGAAQDKNAAKPRSEKVQEGKKTVPIEDPGGSMKHFYAKLKQTAAGKGTTRILQWGDSVIVADMMTATARRKLQERFGDGGHGFMLVSKPWEYYIHQNVEHKASDNWRHSFITKGVLKDKHYGLGGVVSSGHSRGAWATFGTTDKGKTGRKLSRFQVFYATQPGGAEVAVQVDGQEKGSFSTAGDALGDKLYTLDFPDGPHEIKLQSKGGGPARLYGVALEREAPGVVFDCLGVTGSRASTFIRFDKGHFKRQIDMRDPDLVVVMTGSNQSKFKGMSMTQYEDEYSRMVKQVRSARPQTSCLIAGAPDRADKSKGQLATSPLIPKIIAIQRKVALANGCAFWNTYEAMGGENAMLAWHRHRPRLASGDYTHLTLAGGEVLGTIFYDALMASY